MNDELMVFGSRWKVNGLRVVNLRTKKVVKLWPNLKTKLDYVHSLTLNDQN